MDAANPVEVVADRVEAHPKSKKKRDPGVARVGGDLAVVREAPSTNERTER